ncbi:hypothetical protein FOPG_19850 [Fusarium oxysporum f. sp. conglutinans race 2 54008]|uniref:Uncharacterized protein n=1 Tax=Fusarium oxysporum f. sp. conglutinans race 2 54008 TaxID=1089457 RepID=X0GJT0_FUSOX|nr:hypothetical protein FOPG_19850 [Fusarium oxysporum f. sp. conglutinans race 2 54008]
MKQSNVKASVRDLLRSHIKHDLLQTQIHLLSRMNWICLGR